VWVKGNVASLAFPSSVPASTDPNWYIDSRKMLLNAPFFRLALSSRASSLISGGRSGGLGVTRQRSGILSIRNSEDAGLSTSYEMGKW
jgi:hypothetical protein